MNQDQKKLLLEMVTELIHKAVGMRDRDMDRWNLVVSELAKVDADASRSIAAKRDSVKAAQEAMIAFLQDTRKTIDSDFHPEIARILNYWNNKLNVL